jgi:hypothetical protein
VVAPAHRRAYRAGLGERGAAATATKAGLREPEATTTTAEVPATTASAGTGSTGSAARAAGTRGTRITKVVTARSPGRGRAALPASTRQDSG